MLLSPILWCLLSVMQTGGAVLELDNLLQVFALFLVERWFPGVAKQLNIAHSTTEAKYRSMTDVCCEITWLVSLLSEMQWSNLTPVPLFCDKQSALHTASNPFFINRPNILRSTVIWFVRNSSLSWFLHNISLLQTNLLIFSLRRYLLLSCRTHSPS